MDHLTETLLDYVLTFIASMATISAMVVVVWLATDDDLCIPSKDGPIEID